MQAPDAHAPVILVAEDQPDVIEALLFLIQGEGYRAEVAHSPAEAIEALQARDFDAAVVDLDYTLDTARGEQGPDLLQRIQSLDSALPVIVLTPCGSVELALEAVRRGARDFVQKPWDAVRFAVILRTQIELGRALRRQRQLEAENHELRVRLSRAVRVE